MYDKHKRGFILIEALLLFQIVILLVVVMSLFYQSYIRVSIQEKQDAYEESIRGIYESKKE